MQKTSIVTGLPGLLKPVLHSFLFILVAEKDKTEQQSACYSR